jgi:hypothetical protein
MLFDLGKMLIMQVLESQNPKEAMDAPLPNHVDVVVSELIT